MPPSEPNPMNSNSRANRSDIEESNSFDSDREEAFDEGNLKDKLIGDFLKGKSRKTLIPEVYHILRMPAISAHITNETVLPHLRAFIDAN